MMANRMYKALSYMLPQYEILFAVYRSRLSPDFTDTDIDVLGSINEHLNTLYSAFDAIRELPEASFTQRRISEEFRSLSHREAEICSLVARRFNTAEISTSLFISPRTVETHIANIFEKLDVRSRDQLRWKLGVTPTTGLRQPSIGRKSPQIT